MQVEATSAEKQAEATMEQEVAPQEDTEVAEVGLEEVS